MIEINGNEYPVRYSMKALKSLNARPRSTCSACLILQNFLQTLALFFVTLVLNAGATLKVSSLTWSFRSSKSTLRLHTSHNALTCLVNTATKKSVDGNEKPVGWQDLIRMGMGVLHLSPSAFWDMTFGELSLALEANRETAEMLQRFEWERTRWLATIFMQPHLKKGRKLRPKELMQFPWEKPKRNKDNLTTEQLFERIKERDGWQS